MEKTVDARFDEAEKRLSAPASLKDDWDSYGGKAPTPKALERAKELLYIVPTPVPVNDGGIWLTWCCSDGEEFFLRINPDGV